MDMSASSMSGSMSAMDKAKRQAERQARREELERAMEDAASRSAADIMNEVDGATATAGGAGDAASVGSALSHSTKSSVVSGSAHSGSGGGGGPDDDGDRVNPLPPPTSSSGNNSSKNSNKFMESSTWGMDSVSVHRAAPPLSKTDSARNFLWGHDSEDLESDLEDYNNAGRGVSDNGGMFGPSRARAQAIRTLERADEAASMRDVTSSIGGKSGAAFSATGKKEDGRRSSTRGSMTGSSILKTLKGAFGGMKEDPNNASLSSINLAPHAAAAAAHSPPPPGAFHQKKSTSDGRNLRQMQLSDSDYDDGYYHGDSILSQMAVTGSNAAHFCCERRRPLAILAVAVAAVALSVVMIGRSVGRDGIVMPNVPSLTGGASPPEEDSAGRFNAIKSIIVNSGVSHPEVFDDVDSPQSMALSWLSSAQDGSNKMAVDDPYLVQRYALAVFFYGTHDAAQLVDIANAEKNKDDPDAVDVDWKNWDRSDGWLSDAGICAWYGIRCHHRPGGKLTEHTYDDNNGVTAIELPNNHVRGPLPREIFLGLPDLTVLELKENGVTGTIPTEIGTATKLTYLKLESNLVSGTIPSEIGGATSLQHVELSSNGLTGSIPHEICDLTDLAGLGLFHNALTSTLPLQIGRLVNLRTLYVDSNMLTGQIPDTVGALKSATDVRLRRNFFEGSIPKSFGDLPNLRILYLDANALTSTIPPQLGKLDKLEELSLYKNALTGSLPEDLGNMQSLRHLYLDHNDLTSTIPPYWSALHQLQDLFLYKNRLSGSLPNEMGAGMSSLLKFRADGNRLSGQIPPSLGRMEGLEHLIINDNRFVGSLPPQLGQLQKLDKLIAHGNEITGDVPAEVCGLTMDHVLDELELDCGGITAEVQCDCCTKCY